jgi:rSAM/selenodomain-associated transferase 2
MRISIVVPTLNEARQLPGLLAAIRRLPGSFEVIVADGGSEDRTLEIAREMGAVCVSAAPTRAVGMNAGSALATGDALLFLHADTRLPRDAHALVASALSRPGVVGGCFRLTFDSPHPLLALYAFFTRFPFRLFHYGDAAYFVRADVFRRLGGYQPQPILEDLDLWLRMRACGRVVVVPAPVRTSARRYERRGALRQQVLNTVIVVQFLLGRDPRELKRRYADVR